MTVLLPPQVRATSNPTKQVAVLVETDSTSGCRTIRGISNYRDQKEHWHLLLDPRDHEHRRALPDAWHGSGIIAAVNSQDQLSGLRARGLPLVVVGDLQSEDLDTCTVANDEKHLAEMAFSHLYDRGFRQFAYFAPPARDFSPLRGDAFTARVEEAGFKCSTFKPGYRVGRRLSWSERLKRVERWIRTLPRPVGVLAVDASRARQLTEVCHLCDVRVPDDVAVLAGSLDELHCDVSTPPLSAVNVNSEKIGFEAARLLDRMMSGEADRNETIQVPPTGVRSRQSTDLLSIDEPDIAEALRFIRRNAHTGICVKDILKEVAISRRSLEIQFQRYIGRSPAREIRRVQLEISRELLGRNEMSIHEVARASGFANSTRFGVSFKRDIGKTPQEYRKEVYAAARAAAPHR